MSSRAPWLHGRYPASSLLRAPPPPSRLRPTSRGIPVIRPTWLRRFLGGTRTASPVAQRILVTVLPLPPHRSESTRRSGFVDPYCLRLITESSASGVQFVSGPPMGSLALRPGDSLTIPRMALSVGFRTFGFPPVCDSSYRAPDSCPGGTDSRWMRQPSAGRTVFSNLVREESGSRSEGVSREGSTAVPCPPSLLRDRFLIARISLLA